MIELSKINSEGGTQARSELNQSVVADYAEIYKSGGAMPPVVVFFDGAQFWLADGFHRFHGARAAGLLEINEQREIGTQRDAVLYSLSANAKHGLRRTNADKRKAVETLLNDAEWAKWSNEAIAKACCVSPHTVADLKKSISANAEMQSVRKVERNGKTYEQNTSNIGKTKPETVDTVKPDSAPVAEPAYDPADDEAEEMKEAVRTIAAENDVLRVRLAMNANGATDEEKAFAFENMEAKDARIRALEAEVSALRASRDKYQRDNADMKSQLASQRKLIAKLQKVEA